MKQPKQLDAKTIRSECSISSFQNGQNYFNQGRVTDLQIDSENADSIAISARVKGSHATPYKQLVAIRWHGENRQATIVGRCSCPIGYNCKHVAAACLEYQRRLQNKTQPVNVGACFDWLESLNEEQPPEIDPYKEFLAYLLKPVAAKQDFTIEFVITKFKKAGGLGKGRTLSLNSLLDSFLYGLRLPPYLQAQDEETLRLLSSLGASFHLLQLKGRPGGLALANMLATGRLFWKNLEEAPLTAGETRELDCAWRVDAQGDYRLAVQIKPDALLITTEPPYYLDSSQRTLGLVDCPQYSAVQLRKLAAAPAVPAKQAAQFSQRMIIEYPDLKLPTPQKVEVTDIDNLPASPHLTLQGMNDGSGHYFHVLKLAFNYGPHRLQAYQPEQYSVLQSGQGFLRIRRDVEYEQQCLDRLFADGFDIANGLAGSELLFYSPATPSLQESAQRWHDFLQYRLPQLQALGWLIETDASFRMNFQTAANWEAEIEEGRNDWFEMRFTIEVNGLSLPLLPLLMPVLENYEADNLPEILTLPLGDHDYLTLPSDKLKPFLTILYEVFNTFSLSRDGVIKLSRFDAAGLAELETHSYGLFSFKGGEALRELGCKIKDFHGIADAALPDNLQAELRPYQQQGLNWLQFLREYQFGGILADDMGLGKTVQTLAHLLLEKNSGRMNAPSLIIAPTSLMSNWRREAARFTPDLKVLVLQGAERKQQFENIHAYDLVLTTYPLLPRDEENLLAQNYYYLILDEAQVVKNPNAKAAKIVRAVKAEHRLCLTGTPMENHLGELWTQFDFLMPGFLGDSAAFKQQYRTPIEIHGDSERQQKLSKRIKPFMLRRSKLEVAAELPLKTEIIRAVALGPKQAILYESLRLSMEQKVQQAIAEKGLARSHITILDALLKLRQTCCDPRTLPFTEARKIKESAKLELLMDMLPELLAEGRRILVFSQFTRMIALIEKELDARRIAYSKLTGQTQNRDEAIEVFKSGAANVFLISLKAGGVGLNLTEADTVIIYDPWWNPAVESQAADRAHRIGQEKPVFVYKLITENTVEEKILAMQDKKRALAEGVYQGGKKDASLSLTAEDLTALFEPL